MIALLWLRGLLARRPGRLLGALGGVSVAVALLVSIGAFAAQSAASMTARAVAEVAVDWQVQVESTGAVSAVEAAIKQAAPVTSMETVGYADVPGLSAVTGSTTQTTGASRILGISSNYRATFPKQFRQLVGAPDGVLVAQQTAANVRVGVGDRLTIERVGLPSVDVSVDGIVDIPNADSLFQPIGVPPSAAPTAPPDNVVIMPLAEWHKLFDPQIAIQPGTAKMQVHVRLGRDFPSDPASALATVRGRARNLEVRLAGTAQVGDNLAARLDSVRADALYARVLFLFLGLPGAVLAAMLAVAVANTGSDRRRREQALLRTRGATTAQILRLAATEAIAVGVGGLVVGLGLAVLGALIGRTTVSTQPAVLVWAAGAGLAGLLVALAAIVYPAWAEARSATVASARREIDRIAEPLWQRAYLDVVLLVASVLVFWATARTGYQVVLAPEGVPQSSVDYQAFLAPLCLWLGASLVASRLLRSMMRRYPHLLVALLRPVVGTLAGVVASWLRRQRALVARGAVLVAVAVAFAVSTAVFDTTYNAQAHVDAELTNGADVQVTGRAGAAPGSRLAALRTLPGVVAAQPMLHRFAYVGTDLQDLYGIDPGHLGDTTTLANAYFASGSARATLAALAAQADGLLVSAETAHDYQLATGDQVTLRLQSASGHQYHAVPFRFVGIVREFPTAPKDSFLVANAAYVAQQTGNDAAEIVLLRTSTDPAGVAATARGVVAQMPGVTVTDIGSAERAIGASLTAVDLRGLTRIELAFAVLLVTGASGLILALGLAERRRAFAILAALGATERQMGMFSWSEGALILLVGAVVGTGLGFGIAAMLVAVLTGVFDPAPEALAIPWPYLAALAVAATGATGVAIITGLRVARQAPGQALREQ